MNIKVSEAADIKKWESGLAEFAYSIFITPQWLEAVKNPERIPVYLDFYLNEKIVGKTAGLKITRGGLRKQRLFLYAFPSLSVSGEKTIQHFVSKLIKYAADNRFNRLTIKSYDRPFVSNLNIKDFLVSDNDEYIIDLTQNMVEIQKGFNKLTMRKVKKAKKNGAVFYEGQSANLLDRLILLLDETKTIRLSKGYEKYSYFYIPFLDKTVLQKTLENGLAKTFYVKTNDTTNCVLLVLTHKGRAYNLLVGANSEAYKLGIPSFIHYSAVIRLKELGIESYNLGSIPDDSSESGLIFFKTSLGAKKISCTGGSTNYLLFPYNCLNSLLNAGRKIPENNFIRAIKKIV